MSHFQDSFWVGNGYEEMHRFVKQGEEFCRELEGILQERSDIEKKYVEGLHKLVMKAKKSSKKCVGTVQNVWQKVTVELEAEEEVHRSLSFGLQQDCAKQLSSVMEQQIKQRHTVEAQVKERLKVLGDKHKQQLRAKKSSHKTCRDLETHLETLSDAKAGRGKVVSDKDLGKLERNCGKLEEAMVRSDREYRDANMKTEEARLAWQAAMYRCCQTLEALELERIQQVQNVLTKYSQLVETIITPTEQTCEEVIEAAGQVSAEDDVYLICSQLGTGPNQPEQILLVFYEEDLKNPMNSDRRIAYLEKKLKDTEEEITRQEKAKQGVESLRKVYEEQPDFTDDKGADDVSRQLMEADALLSLLKATHFKLLSAHAEVSNSAEPTSELSEYIHTTKDKQTTSLLPGGGPALPMTSSVLRIPPEQLDLLTSQPLLSFTPSVTEATSSSALYSKPIKKSSRKVKSSSSVIVDDTPPTNDEPPPYNDNEWGNDFESSSEYPPQNEGGGASATLQFHESDGQQYIGQCEAVYDYTANQEDELSIQPGDIINIIEKQDQDWWKGEVKGQIGIFPATYVQEM